MAQASKIGCDYVSLENLFVPDVVTPAQFYGQRRDTYRLQPVRKLMLAVLEDALRCFQTNFDARSESRRRLFREAEEWIYGKGGEGPFSFTTVCETLEIEARLLRSGLQEWRARHLCGASTRPLARRSPVVRTGRISAPQRRRRTRLVTQA